MEALQQRIDKLKQTLTQQEEINKKEELLIQDELKQNELYIQRQEQLFKKIKEVSQVNSINDMLPHFIYLQQNKEKLNQSIELLKVKLAQKKEKIGKLKKDLMNLNYCTENKKQEAEVTPEQLDEKVQEKKKQIDYLEQKIVNTSKILTSTFTIVGKLLYQLSENQTIFSCNQKNIVQYLSEVGLKIESLMQAIQKRNLNLSQQNPNYKQIPEQSIKIQDQKQENQEYEWPKEVQLRSIDPQEDEDNIANLLKMNKQNVLDQIAFNTISTQ